MIRHILHLWHAVSVRQARLLAQGANRPPQSPATTRTVCSAPTPHLPPFLSLCAPRPLQLLEEARPSPQLPPPAGTLVGTPARRPGYVGEVPLCQRQRASARLRIRSHQWRRTRPRARAGMTLIREEARERRRAAAVPRQERPTALGALGRAAQCRRLNRGLACSRRRVVLVDAAPADRRREAGCVVGGDYLGLEFRGGAGGEARDVVGDKALALGGVGVELEGRDGVDGVARLGGASQLGKGSEGWGVEEVEPTSRLMSMPKIWLSTSHTWMLLDHSRSKMG